MPGPAGPAPAPVKPGHRTSEFYVHWAAIILSALFAADVIPTSGLAAKLAAMACSILLSLGYTVSRTVIKTKADVTTPAA